MVTLNQNARILSLLQDFCNAAITTRAYVTANYPVAETLLLRLLALWTGLASLDTPLLPKCNTADLAVRENN